MLLPSIVLSPCDRLVRPGIGIGAARLGRSNDWNWQRFPGKAAGDGTTRTREHAFKGRKTITLAGPTSRNVTAIATDSSRFHLASGLNVGSSAHRMRIAFLDARAVQTDGPRVRWDDVRRGLDWWTAGGRVFEIEVHRPGMTVDKRETYLSSIVP